MPWDWMTKMAMAARLSLEEYLALPYPFSVFADQEIGGYVVTFPDLPGCTTHVERIDDVGAVAEEIRQLWILTEYEDGESIPLPSSSQDYSGKFIVRAPRSLHRQLVLSADREGVSLNQHVVTVLARGDAVYQMDGQVGRLCEQMSQLQAQVRTLDDRLSYEVRGVPKKAAKDQQFYNACGRFAVAN